jgi:hypothetical protein
MQSGTGLQASIQSVGERVRKVVSTLGCDEFIVCTVCIRMHQHPCRARKTPVTDVARAKSKADTELQRASSQGSNRMPAVQPLGFVKALTLFR